MRKQAKATTKTATTSFSDVYAQITAKILESMETADRWQKPWNPGIGKDGAGLARPISLSSGKAYRGINTVLLWSAGYSSPLWATYAHWSSIGAQVRKGEKATTVILFKPRIITTTDANGIEEEKSIPLARAFSVFNVEQVDGYASPALPVVEPITEPARLANVERFFAYLGVPIRHGGNRAFYSPSTDFIQMPHRAQFIGTKTSSALESYYSTLCHEATHSTGHKSRCDRDFSGRFGDMAYAFEELVAEFGASFLCADLAISSEPRPDHAQYLKSWIKVLKDDKRAIFKAASLAEKACAYLHSRQPEEDTLPVIVEPVEITTVVEPVDITVIVEPVAVIAKVIPLVAPRTSRKPGKSKKGRWPLPVYVATFDNGEVARYSFWSEVGKPLNIAKGREICAIGHGIQPMDGDRPVRVALYFLAPSTPRVIVSGHVEHDGEEYADTMEPGYTIWPVGEAAKAKPNAKATAQAILALLAAGRTVPADVMADLVRIAA